jgi:hypothetical protein
MTQLQTLERSKQKWLKDISMRPVDDAVLDGKTARIFFMQTLEGNTNDGFTRTPQAFEMKLTPEAIRTLISLRNQKARKGFKIVYMKTGAGVTLLFCICFRTHLLSEAYEALVKFK